MGSSLYMFMFMRFFFLLHTFHFIKVTKSYSPLQQLCHNDEHAALLNFKHNLSFKKFASDDPSAYPKVASWKLESRDSDCCTWDGVECDQDTGHVIGLQLNSSFLYGSIDSNSSLFDLVHLQRLNLADNDFNYSHIPSKIARLSMLSTLNLSSSAFYGQVPSQISGLSKLVSLDLTGNFNVNFLKLEKSGLKSLVQNLTNLKKLYLGEVDISSQVPENLANLTSLKELGLRNCGLYGEFPTAIFHLPNLEVLSVRYNENLTGSLPEFHRISPLKILALGATSFSGVLPYSIENLSSLSILNLHSCHFSGYLPVSLKNLTQLKILNVGFNMLHGSLPVPSPNIFIYLVSSNFLVGEIPSSFCSISSLFSLDLSNNTLRGTIPLCLGNLSSLLVLNLKSNKFSGNILQTYGEGKNLRMLDLSQNQLKGQMPKSLANCTNLEILNLAENQIDDTFPFWLGALPKLRVLVLRSNRFHGAIEGPTTNNDFSKLQIIDLSNNGFTSFWPSNYFKIWNAMKIVHEDQVAYLKANITFLVLQRTWDLSYNYTMSITNKAVKTNYSKILNILNIIDLSSNKFSGKIPQSIGNLMGLQSLNLSNNNLIGPIPPSLGKLSCLESLDLSHNKLSGEIPLQLVLLNFLEVLNVSYNNLTGPIPKGKQFDTFQNDSYVGNLALFGEPLSKRCGDAGTTQHLTIKQDNGFEFPSGGDWVVTCLGLGSGLVVGLIGGRILTTRNHEWFVKKFGKRKANGRRQRKSGQRSSILS